MLLYLHIPFCDSKCHYCAFNSYTHLHHLKKAYMKAIMIQLDAEFKRFNVSEKSIETLFIGGGTPSCIEAKEYQPFFDFIRPYMHEGAEMTTEANPNSATYTWLSQMYALGINRISFGVQSFNSQKLKFLNRSHSPQEAVLAVNNAHKIGFKNISLDLIYGTALDNQPLLLHDIETALSLPINHISSYSLTIEEGTKFMETPQVAYDDEESAYWFVSEVAKRGLPQYEISNFGHYESRHNKGYWQYKDYIGVGSGAVGFLKEERFYTQNDVADYIDNPLTISTEHLSIEDIKHEKILLGMRSNVGFDSGILNKDELDKASQLLLEQKLTYHDKKFFNPNFFLADELALYITS